MVVAVGFHQWPAARRRAARPDEGAWTEPNGNKVRVDAVGVDWEELAGVLGALRFVDAARWPDMEIQPRLARCVDARSQLAPTAPAGSTRFVLQAQPTGTCGQFPFLMVSFVLSGTLVTIVTSPATEWAGVVGAIEASS